MKLLALLLAFVLVCISLHAAAAESNVVELTDQTFWEFLGNHPDDAVFVELYVWLSCDFLMWLTHAFSFAPWCGHCQHLAPTWEELGTEMVKRKAAGEISAIVAKVDATQWDGSKHTSDPSLLILSHFL